MSPSCSFSVAVYWLQILGAYFIQTQTPFGASASCLHFERIAHLLRWIIQHAHPSAFITNYLDDFWLTQKTQSQLIQLLQRFISIIETEIGFPISHNKTLGPSTRLDFVGLTADLVHLRILLPEDKRTKCLNLINKLLKAYLRNRFVKVKDLEHCAGVLNYACQAIPVGRPWLQSIYALQWVSGDHITDRTISKLVMQDLTMFKSFLESDTDFVKSVPFLDRLGVIHSVVEIKADASGNPSLGLGCFLPHTCQWFGKLWSETNWFNTSSSTGLEARHMIYQLELFAITLAFKVFGLQIQGRVIILHSDNMAVVNSINKMTSHLESSMQLLHELTLTCMSLQILGLLNRESDLISRDRSCQFLKENPRSLNLMKEVPSRFWPPSWQPSMQPRFLGKTEFWKANQPPFGFSKTHVKERTSRWH